jgi:hypothetical protein
MFHHAACRAMAANPREGSRLLRFWVKAPNTNSEIGTTRLARVRARGTSEVAFYHPTGFQPSDMPTPVPVSKRCGLQVRWPYLVDGWQLDVAAISFVERDLASLNSPQQFLTRQRVAICLKVSHCVPASQGLSCQCHGPTGADGCDSQMCRGSGGIMVRWASIIRPYKEILRQNAFHRLRVGAAALS